MARSLLLLTSWRKAAVWPALGLMVLLFIAVSPSLLAEGTNTVPVQPVPAAGTEDIGQYLADHEADLTPVFEKHADELAKQALPLVLEMMGSIIMLFLIVSWISDVGLSFGFSKLFSPLYAKLKQALLFATASLVLGVVLGVLAAVAAFALSGTSPLAVLVALGLAALIYLACQTFLVSALYRSNVMVSAVFCMVLIVVHVIVLMLVALPLIKTRTGVLVTQFIDQNVTTQLRNATAESKHDLAQVQEALNKVKADQTDAQNRLDQANTEQKTLGLEIESKKNSESFIYAQIAGIHARGDLNGARDQLTAFLAKYPSGSLAGAAQTQLAQVNSELAAQDAQKKQAEADAAQAAAQARADLLAKAAKGEATLSEMRDALIGKTRDQVTGLLGTPSDIGSDRWGYAQQMILNPLTNEKYGLTIYFTEGQVQGVDYSYGAGGAK